jgi:hypothetical protein
MEGTGDFLAIKGPFRKRPTAMGTSIIDSMERTLYIKESDLLAAHFDHLTLTGSDLIGFSYFTKPAITHLLPNL